MKKMVIVGLILLFVSGRLVFADCDRTVCNNPANKYEQCGTNSYIACDLTPAKIRAAIAAANTNWNGSTTDWSKNPNVMLPAGTSDWLTIAKRDIPVVVPGGINIIGAGSPHTSRDSNGKWTPAPTTVLRSQDKALYGGIFVVNDHHSTSRAAPVRIANIKFQGTSGTGTFVHNTLAIDYGLDQAGTPNFRIDHCEITGGAYQVPIAIGSSDNGGVIDHNNFLDIDNPPTVSYSMAISTLVKGDNKPLGGPNFVFIEDNYWEDNFSHPASGFCGGSWVFRYNVLRTYRNAPYNAIGGIDVHGAADSSCANWCSAGQPWDVGGGPWEAYNNRWIQNPNAPSPRGGALFIRSRYGVVFNNIFENFKDRETTEYLNDPGSCPGNKCNLPAYWDMPGRSGNYNPGIWIWNNTYVNSVGSTCWSKLSTRYHCIDPDACSQSGILYASTCNEAGKQIYGGMDGIGGNTGCPAPHPCDPAGGPQCQGPYVPYTYPHPVTLLGGPNPPPPPPPPPPPKPAPNPPKDLRINKP